MLLDRNLPSAFAALLPGHRTETTHARRWSDLDGGPMKGSTMVATLEHLGVLPSFSRPRVSNDNPFSESLFRTLKYCAAYPSRPSADLDAAYNLVRLRTLMCVGVAT